MKKTYIMLIAIFAFSSTLLSYAAKKEGKTAAGFHGTLFQSLFNGPTATFSLKDLDQRAYAALPDSLKTRLVSYAERYTRFHTRIISPEATAGITATPRDIAVYTKRQSVERAIFALSNVPAIEDSAVAYAAQAYLHYDWKKRSDSPLTEAVYAEKYVNNPTLRPYLLLFLLHRYRCGYESFIKEQTISTIRQCSERYREVLRQARAYPDPLVGLIADDLDRFPKNINESPTMTGGDVHP